MAQSHGKIENNHSHSVEFDVAKILSPKDSESFATKGRSIIDNFAPIEVANQLHNRFNSATWDQVFRQERKDHYKHVFATDSKYLPSADERYLAQFSRSTDLEDDRLIEDFYKSYIEPILYTLSGKKFDVPDLRCIGMFTGDYFRVHVDDYAGDVGFIYYVNKEWKWDWGGLLGVADDDDVKVFLPVFNRLVVLNHRVKKNPHFVTTINTFAGENRFTLIGLCK